MVSTTPLRLKEFKSAYGPKYSYQPNLAGFSAKQLGRIGYQTSLFGVGAGIALLFYASGIPRVQKDILQKIPFIGSYWVKEVNPADNPF